MVVPPLDVFLLELVGGNGRPYKPPARFAGDLQGFVDVAPVDGDREQFMSTTTQISDNLMVNAQ
jgi:hypothetical protein